MEYGVEQIRVLTWLLEAIMSIKDWLIHAHEEGRSLFLLFIIIIKILQTLARCVTVSNRSRKGT